MTTTAPFDTAHPRDTRGPSPGDPVTPPAGPSRRAARLRSAALPVLPWVWVACVLVLTRVSGPQIQLTPLLAAAPALACAAGGRIQCVVLGAGGTVFTLVPVTGTGDLDDRIGPALAVLMVAALSFLTAQRRLREQRAFDELRRIAEVTQRVLLRPVPGRVGPFQTAVRYFSAAAGARVGGDFYEVLETPGGIRAIVGDMRGCGLGAVGGAAAVLGAFREAGAVEPDLAAVAARLDDALARRNAAALPDPAGPAAAADEADSGYEDFATAVLVELSGADDTARRVRYTLCGHPEPYLLRDGVAHLLAPDRPTPPLGLRTLAGGPAAAPAVGTVDLRPGDALVLYTDGITDARDAAGEFFPLAGVLGGLDRPDSGQVADLVGRRLAAHTGGRMKDDATVFVLTWRNERGAASGAVSGG